MKLYVKNMVCNRCKMVVGSELEKLGFQYHSVELGEVDLKSEISDKQKIEIDFHLQKFGFELIDDRKSRTIEKIKSLIIDLVHHQDSKLEINLSVYLATQLAQEYSVLTTLFSEVEGKTIEQYFISQKVEKVKELIVYDELSLSEISDKLKYSSVAHLSNQFKKVTGFTPSYFKQLKDKRRLKIDEL
ncbi:MAG: AraC family transcriptional regulator [Bacteroidales bacterium]|nr:AraC family transcriptional regulator [Bacteroidales bacterium]